MRNGVAAVWWYYPIIRVLLVGVAWQRSNARHATRGGQRRPVCRASYSALFGDFTARQSPTLLPGCCS